MRHSRPEMASGISALARGGEWQRALQLLSEMPDMAVEANIVSPFVLKRLDQMVYVGFRAKSRASSPEALTLSPNSTLCTFGF